MKTYQQIFCVNHMNIPIDFCRHVLTEKITKQACLFAYLSYNTSGNFLMEKLDRQTILTSLKLKKWETVSRRLKWLIKSGWIFYKGSVLYLRSFSDITLSIGITTVKGAIFQNPDFRIFREFAVAACITYQIAKNKWVGGIWGPNKRGSIGKPPHPNFLSGSFDDCGNKYLANHLGLSKTTGHNYKQQIQKAAFANISHRIIDSGYKTKDLNALKDHEPDLAAKLLKCRNRLMLQCPDTIVTSIMLRSHRGLRRLRAQVRNK